MDLSTLFSLSEWDEHGLRFAESEIPTFVISRTEINPPDACENPIPGID
jgi:hypothetical protein